ncbi:hypothetical protein QR680_010900 [Steinernema hermaphroditum]|uniref:Uncharacterized protein n=1 Tax=Steinernema hermaphroditum TaxID=289476 RepID=A0AA39IT82_9BILA|nr:hypothetical protein QR680_010900 [Steinernema hermaphroditum]
MPIHTFITPWFLCPVLMNDAFAYAKTDYMSTETTSIDLPLSLEVSLRNDRLLKTLSESIERRYGQIPQQCLRYHRDGSIDFDSTLHIAYRRKMMEPVNVVRHMCALNAHKHIKEVYGQIPHHEQSKLRSGRNVGIVRFVTRFLSYDNDLSLIAMDPYEVYKECLELEWYSAAAWNWFHALATKNTSKREALFDFIAIINKTRDLKLSDEHIEMALKAMFRSPREVVYLRSTMKIPKESSIEEIDEWLRRWASGLPQPKELAAIKEKSQKIFSILNKIFQ